MAALNKQALGQRLANYWLLLLSIDLATFYYWLLLLSINLATFYDI